MRGRVLGIINHGIFKLDRFRCFGPPVGENRYLPLAGGIALTCYTVIIFKG